MSLRLSEARKVGRYIEKLYEDVERFRETGEITGDLVENPEKVLEVLQSFPLHELIEVTFFTFMLIAVAGEESGDREMAEELKKSLLVYASELQLLLEACKKQIGELRTEGVMQP